MTRLESTRTCSGPADAGRPAEGRTGDDGPACAESVASHTDAAQAGSSPVAPPSRGNSAPTRGPLGAARLGYGRCPSCGRPRRLFAALLTTSAPRGCRRCVAVLVLVATTVDRWRWLADRAQRAERARVAARARRAA